MWDREPSGRTTRGSTAGARSDHVSQGAKLAGAILLLALAVWLVPRHDGIFTSLSPRARRVTVTGIVRTAPHSAPLAGAMVYSDRDLVLTDANGLFRLSAEKGTLIQVEAAGYGPAHHTVEDESPVIFMLFPESSS